MFLSISREEDQGTEQNDDIKERSYVTMKRRTEDKEAWSVDAIMDLPNDRKLMMMTSHINTR